MRMRDGRADKARTRMPRLRRTRGEDVVILWFIYYYGFAHNDCVRDVSIRRTSIRNVDYEGQQMATSARRRAEERLRALRIEK